MFGASVRALPDTEITPLNLTAHIAVVSCRMLMNGSNSRSGEKYQTFYFMLLCLSTWPPIDIAGWMVTAWHAAIDGMLAMERSAIGVPSNVRAQQVFGPRFHKRDWSSSVVVIHRPSIGRGVNFCPCRQTSEAAYASAWRREGLARTVKTVLHLPPQARLRVVFCLRLSAPPLLPPRRQPRAPSASPDVGSLRPTTRPCT